MLNRQFQVCHRRVCSPSADCPDPPHTAGRPLSAKVYPEKRFRREVEISEDRIERIYGGRLLDPCHVIDDDELAGVNAHISSESHRRWHRRTPKQIFYVPDSPTVPYNPDARLDQRDRGDTARWRFASQEKVNHVEVDNDALR